MTGERFIYVVEFTSDTVKVGQAGDAAYRINVHRNGARQHGHDISNTWVSEPHANSDHNETALIEFCANRWYSRGGREHFAEAAFEEVVKFAQTLSYDRSDGDSALPYSIRSIGLSANGPKIRSLRELRGMSATKLAHAAQLSPDLVYKIELNKKPCGGRALGRIANALGVPMEDLLVAEQVA